VEDSNYCHYLTEYKGSTPQSDLVACPKRILDVRNCEIMRFVKLIGCEKIEHLMWQVPRKSVDIYHEDIFPPAPSGNPALTSDEWFSGHTKPPILVDLRPEGFKSIYEVDPLKKERDQQQRPRFERQDSVKSDGSIDTTNSTLPSEPIKIVIPKLFTTSATDANVNELSSEVEDSEDEDAHPSDPTKNGFIKETFPDGSTFEGEYKNGRRHGKGILKCTADNSQFNGMWLHNKKHGPGILTVKDFNNGNCRR
jgi:coronin-1B/1C/6